MSVLVLNRPNFEHNTAGDVPEEETAAVVILRSPEKQHAKKEKKFPALLLCDSSTGGGEIAGDRWGRRSQLEGRKTGERR